MIKISIKVLALYLRANPTEQQALLRRQKYPLPEQLTPLRYHNRARSLIAAHHRGDLSLEQLESAIVTMRGEARGTSRFLAAELRSNAEVIANWVAHQAHRALVVSASRPFEMRRTDVELTAKPNLTATEHDERRLIFFMFGNDVAADHMRQVAQLAFEVVSPWLRNLRPREIQIVNRLGGLFQIDRASRSLGGEIAIACKAISKAWPNIQPPAGWTDGLARGDRQLSIDWHPV
jgi:hypothetical protein